MYLLGLLLLVTAFGKAQAQNVRPDGSFFIRPHLGLSSYLGDNEKSPVNFNFDAFDVGDKVPFSAGLEAGYQFSPRWSASAAYYLADYPVIFQTGDRLQPYVDSSTLRHTAALLLRYTVMGESWPVAPYLQTGFNASLGNSDRLDNMVGYGPSVGAGLDIAVSDRTSLMLEWNANMNFPDEAIDATNQGGFGNFDVLSTFGLGLKFNFSAPFVPVRLINVSSPDTLNPGEIGTFTATANVAEATTPLDFTWDFGDGTTASGLSATHAYALPGTYSVTFTAANEKSSDEASMLVTVEPLPVPASIVTLSADPMEPDTETPVNFWAETTGDEPRTYTWDFGDGTTSTDMRPTHAFEQPGTYTVSLNVVNEAGADERSLTLTVERYEPTYCADIAEMNTVYFEENGSILTEEGKTHLMENVELLAECWSVSATVTGWAAPGEHTPQNLSEDRAAAVKDFYVANGIAAERIEAQGNGVAPEATTMKVNGSRYQRADTDPIR